jgi:endo-1,4-beta-xylanase
MSMARSQGWNRRAFFGAVAIAFFGCSMILRAQTTLPAEPAKESAHPQAIVLWPNGAPGSEARKAEPEKLDWRAEPENNITFPVLFNIHNPSIVPFIPDKAKATGAAVVVAPGGGHMFLTIDREGYDLAKWLADHGVAAFVLKYRLARDRVGNSPYKVDVDALADSKRAMRVVRSRAAEWGIDPNRIGFMGFSAGGELAGLLSTRFDKGDASASDPIEKVSCEPNFNGFIYGGPYRVEQFESTMAPSFLMCAYNDQGNARNLANLFLKLQAAKVPAELHIYATGGHGFGVRSDRGLAEETWPARFVEWMKDMNLLSPKKSS